MASDGAPAPGQKEYRDARFHRPPGASAGARRAPGAGTTVKAPFHVVDAKDNPLLTVETNPIKANGGATVRFFDAAGHEYAMFDNPPAGGSLSFFTVTREAALSLNAQRDGGYLSLNNNAGRECVLLTSSPQQNGPRRVLRSQAGEPLFSKP
jgi:hypothetical protein